MKISKVFKFREGEQGEAVKPFLDHLEDLRWVIIKMAAALDRKSTRLNSSHLPTSRMPSSA